MRSTMSFRRAPLDWLGNLFTTYGDVCSFRLATNRIVVLNHPHHVKHVLQQKAGNYNRSTMAHKMARNLFGQGLATVEGGPEWRRQRRLMQPSFHYQRVASMSEHMLAVIRARLDQWDELVASNEVINTNEEMRRLTLRVVARALFALEEEKVVDRFAQAIDTIDRELTAYMQMPLLPLSVPTAGHRRFWSSHQIVEEIIDYVITKHLLDEVDRGDLLSMLIQTVDEETGERMSNEQLRDQVFVMLFAGHETGANVLTWVFYRLGLHPDVQQRVQQEVDNELAGRPPTIADCSKLVYTRTVVDEAQRMYPQQWQGWRRALEDDEIGGYRIPAGTDIFFSPYHMHRHPDFWEDPDEFRPDRFIPEETAKRDRSSYIPFGSGPHVCIGNQFAMSEMLLIIASTVQRYRVELASRELVAPKQLITLGPDKPINVRLMPRNRRSG
ncbi:cytochrome P450 [Actinophytocola sp.]|uniref:cytochrome P450 n=1 Tax=Actinophytocola sp. TaxID=1872138 RepID=UPI0025C5FCB0|nr:cytochrome P450 [Actinophytocola sp.]